MIERRQITDRAEWLAWRKQDITASAAGALLGLHPYSTPLQLYLDKTGIVPLDGQDSPAMRRGRILERLAPELVAEARPDWSDIGQPALYLRDAVHRIGATPDLFARDERGRFGVIEIKSSDPSIFRRTWCDAEGGINVPVWIALQALMCAHLAGAQWCAVGVMRVGHSVDFDLIDVPLTPGLIERVQEAAAEFWKAVDAGEPPPPAFPADADLVLRLARGIDTGETLELPPGDNYVPALLAEYAQASAEVAEREQRRKVIKAEVLARMGTASVLTQGGRILCTSRTIHKKAETKPRPASSFRDFRIPAGALDT